MRVRQLPSKAAASSSCSAPGQLVIAYKGRRVAGALSALAVHELVAAHQQNSDRLRAIFFGKRPRAVHSGEQVVNSSHNLTALQHKGSVTMEEAATPARLHRTAQQQIALSVMAALRVAGPARDGKPHRLRAVDIMRRTGMSRSTLRPLLNPGGPEQRNPDLGTLQRLSDAIGVPVAFLLMTAADWRALNRAIDAVADIRQAAREVVGDELGSPTLAEAVLKRCKVHPERPPLGVAPDPEEMQRLEARNEWRRKSSLVLAALAQPASRGDHRSLAELTALAAALANAMTPHNPGGSHNDHEQEGF